MRVIQCTNSHGEYRTIYAFRDDDLAYLAFHDSRAHPALRMHIEGVTFDGSINASKGHMREEIHGVERWYMLINNRYVYFDHDDTTESSIQPTSERSGTPVTSAGELLDTATCGYLPSAPPVPPATPKPPHAPGLDPALEPDEQLLPAPPNPPPPPHIPDPSPPPSPPPPSPPPSPPPPSPPPVPCLCEYPDTYTNPDGTPVFSCNDTLITFPIGIGLGASYTATKYAYDVFEVIAGAAAQTDGCATSLVDGDNVASNTWSGITISSECRHGHALTLTGRHTLNGAAGAPTVAITDALVFEAACEPYSPPSFPPRYPSSNISQPIASGNVTHSGWGFELEFYENTRTRIYFEPGYAVEAGDLVVFVPKCAHSSNPYATHRLTQPRFRAQVLYRLEPGQRVQHRVLVEYLGSRRRRQRPEQFRPRRHRTGGRRRSHLRRRGVAQP